MIDQATVEEMFQSVGPVTIKKMFGGLGIYVRGTIVAIETDGEIFLKADAASAPQFSDAGARQWHYDGKGKSVSMPYWTVPDDAFDDPDIMAKWVSLAVEAGMRAKK
jgi:DNA transformation protein and related proteins